MVQSSAGLARLRLLMSPRARSVVHAEAGCEEAGQQGSSTRPAKQLMRAALACRQKEEQVRLLQSRLDLAQQQQDIFRQAQAEAQQVRWAQAGEAESKCMLGSGPRVLGRDTGGVRDMCLCVWKGGACTGSAKGAHPQWLPILSACWH